MLHARLDLASGFALGATASITPTWIASVFNALPHSKLHFKTSQSQYETVITNAHFAALHVVDSISSSKMAHSWEYMSVTKNEPSAGARKSRSARTELALTRCRELKQTQIAQTKSQISCPKKEIQEGAS